MHKLAVLHTDITAYAAEIVFAALIRSLTNSIEPVGQVSYVANVNDRV